MSAGQPNWAKLAEMGKLPANARNKVPGLAALDAAEKRIKELEAEVARLKGKDQKETVTGNINNDVAGASPISVKCNVEGCDYVAIGKSEAQARNISLRLHMQAHENKKEPVAV